MSPLVIAVAVVTVAATLHGSPSRPGSAATLGETARLLSHVVPAPSGADPLYPLNHTLDGEGTSLGAPPNAGFEQPGGPVGSPPTNHDLQTAPVDVVTVPNGDFETGTFAQWTVGGSPSIQSDQTHGYWARLGGSGQAITSEAITVPSSAQALVYDVGYLTTNNYSWVKVYVLSGPDFGTSTLVKDDKCLACGTWSTTTIDVSTYLGQSIKLKFSRYAGTVGIDAVRIQELFPGFEVAGTYARAKEGGDASAQLASGSTLTTAPFTVHADAQSGSVELRAETTNAQYQLQVATGPSFSTYTTLDSGVAPTAWAPVRFALSAYAGQQIKLRVRSAYGWMQADDIGLQARDLADWTVTGLATRVDDGTGNHHAAIRGSITSSAFTLPTDVQDFSFRMRSEGTSTQVTVNVLRGPDFATVTQIFYGQATSSWQSVTTGVAPYAGETVKLQVIRGIGGTLDVDDAGQQSAVLPGWTPLYGQALSTGEDADGTFAAPGPGEDAMFLRSSFISTAIVDRPNRVDSRFYAISYELGASGLLQVFWVEPSGAETNVFQDASGTATGYRTRYLWLADFLGERGRFVVKMTGSGDNKLYSLGDNVARQQLSEPFSRKVGLGIDTSTGSVTLSETDLSVPGPIPLSFTRYYTAHADRYGTLGYRWSHTYDTRLVFAEDDVGVIFGSGREEFFLQDEGSFTPADVRVHSALVSEPGGGYTLSTKDNLSYRFTQAGVLSEISDLNGNSLDLAYDAQGRLSTVTGGGGVTLTLAYDGQGRLASLTDPATAVRTYAYDAAGDLVSVTDPEGGVRSYAYDRHRLTSVTDENGDLVVSNAYDDYHRVTSQTDAAGQTIALAYDAPGAGATQVSFPDQGIATFYFDRYGRTTDTLDPTDRLTSFLYDGWGSLDAVIDSGDAAWDLVFDPSGDLTSSTDPLGNPVSFTYDAKHLPTSLTDGRGNATTFTYDGDGNLLTRTDPTGATWTYTYDASGNLLSETDPLNATTTYTYDAAGNRLTKTDPLNHTWTSTYDAANRLKTETDPTGGTTTYSYDFLGRIVGITDPLGRETTYLYDLVGHLLRVEDPAGNRTTWDYDERGLVEAKTDAAGGTTTYTYDSNRHMTSITDPLGRGTTYAYDEAGRLIQVTDPLGHATAYAYDDAGRLASSTDPLGRVTSYAYDAAGRLAQTTLPNEASIAYAYDAAGNLVSLTDELGNATTYVYDEANRLDETTDPLNHTTTYAYDAVGRMVSVTDPLGRETTYGYDAAGRMTASTDPLDHTTSYGYDAAGRRVSITDATERETAYGYDAAGQLTSVTDPGGRITASTYDDAGNLASVTSPTGAVTSYAYDPRGLLSSVTDPLGNVTAYAYDDAGQMTSETDPMGATTTYGHDAAGRMSTITDALGGVVSFGYDAADQLRTLTDPRGETWTYDYDALGIRTSVTDPLGRERTWSYDDAGELTSRTDARGIETTYGYDAARRLVSETFPGGGITHAWDAAGQRTAMTDPTGQSTTTYDASGRVTSVATPRGEITYTYDEAGRRASMTLPGNRTVTYAYNQRGLLGSLIDWQERTTTFSYDADGNRTGISRPNGVVSTYTYDTAGHVTQITHTKGANTLLSFSYTYDDAGRRTSATGPDGTETYTYDALGRLTGVTYPGGPAVAYAYDAAGNRISENRDGQVTTSTYDDAGQLLTVGSKTYTYDADGNLLQAGSDTFAWDHEDRLTQATVGSHTASYAYDGDGNRVGATVDGVPSSYLVDAQGGLPALVDDGSKAYLHADGLLGEIGGGTRYALGDALGSVRGLAEESGSLVGTASYEAFGATRSSSGASSLFGFTGEPTDATGLVYLRARTLDPATGRFLSADSVIPNAPGTSGYNLYAYAGNDPTTWTDPTGHSAIASAIAPFLLPGVGEMLIALGIVAAAVLGMYILAMIIECFADVGCKEAALEYARAIAAASVGAVGVVIDWTIDRLLDAVRNFPPMPVSALTTSGELTTTLEEAVRKDEGGFWSMRVQLEQSQRVFASVPIGPKRDPVTRLQLRSGLWLLFLQAKDSAFPRRGGGEAALRTAVIKTSIWIGGVPDGVGVSAIGTVHKEWLPMSGGFRIDVENLAGTNLVG
jgi:RHS repeat-associated protein